MENKTEIVQHKFKMQYISMLPRYVKLFSNGGFLSAFQYTNLPHFRVMSNTFKRNWMEVAVTQISILPWFSQTHEPNKPKAHVLASYLYFNSALGRSPIPRAQIWKS